ncbi:MAG: hypothetical protein QF516_10205, partial [Pirellulaceae bacterium]|nr:hypothetical protein [Pirellulaceae bacterium]
QQGTSVRQQANAAFEDRTIPSPRIHLCRVFFDPPLIRVCQKEGCHPERYLRVADCSQPPPVYLRNRAVIESTQLGDR